MATHSITPHDPNEAKRWLIIGAYQAGASESRIARISGLSRTAVRRIILNYQRTEIPSLPQELPRSVREKPIVEYDEDGNLVLDEDDEESGQVPGTDEHDIGRLHNKHFEKQRHLPTKRSAEGRITKSSPNKKISRLPTTKEIIAYVSQQMHPSCEPTNSLAALDHSDDDTPSLASSPSSSSTPMWRPLTPPRDSSASPDDKMMHIPPSATVSVALPPSPPLQGQHVPRLPPVSKFEQTIRGFEEWTHEDDIMLIEHVFKRLEESRWKELEAKMEGRHTARLCKERWKYLQSLLLQGTTKANNETCTDNESDEQGQGEEENEEEEVYELEETDGDDQEMEDHFAD